jgi:hypothetical protein
MLQTLLEKYEEGDQGLDEKWAKFFVLGLALLYLGGDPCLSFSPSSNNVT